MSGVVYTKGPNLLTDDELFPGWEYYIARDADGDFSGTAKFVKLARGVTPNNAPVFTDLKPDSENQFISWRSYVNSEFQISAHSGRVYNTVPNFIPVVTPISVAASTPVYTKGDICRFDDMLWPNRVYFIQGDGISQFSGLAKFAGLNNGLGTVEFTDLIPDENNCLVNCSQYAPGTGLRFGISRNSARIYVATPVEPPAPVANVTDENDDDSCCWGLYVDVDSHYGNDRDIYHIIRKYDTKAEAEADLVETQMRYEGNVTLRKIPNAKPVQPAQESWGIWEEYHDESGNFSHTGENPIMVYKTRKEAEDVLDNLQVKWPRGLLVGKVKDKKSNTKLSEEELKTRKLKEEERLLKIQEENRRKEVERQEAERLRLAAEEKQRIEDEKMIKEIQEVYEILD